MKAEKKIGKLFMNGRSQAIRLPKEFRLAGDEVNIQKSGNALIITPKSEPESWDALYKKLDSMPGTLGEREQPQLHQDREELK